MEHINQGRLISGVMLFVASAWFLFLAFVCGSMYALRKDSTTGTNIFFWTTLGLGLGCLGGGLMAFFLPELVIVDGNIVSVDSSTSLKGYTIVYPYGKTNSSLENRAVIDYNCADLIPDDVNCEPGSVHGFISVDEDDSIKNMPENYGYGRGNPVKATSGFVFADNWDDLVNGDFKFNDDKKGSKVTEAFWPHGDRTLRYDQYDTTFWSGSNEGGTTNTETEKSMFSSDIYNLGTCNNWKGSDSIYSSNKASVGSLRQTGPKWLAITNNSCGTITKNTLLCVCKEQVVTKPENL